MTSGSGDKRAVEKNSIPNIHILPHELDLNGDSSEPMRRLLDRFESSRNSFVGSLRKLPAILEMARALDPKQLYVIEWPPEAIEALARGTASWKRATNGSIETAVRAKNGGQYIKHLRLRETQGAQIDLSGLNNMAVQSTLAEIISRLEDLATKMNMVIAGQRSDRQGLVDAGENLYRQALACRHVENRHKLLHSAVQELERGRMQIMRALSFQASTLKRPTGTAPLRGDTPTQQLAAAFNDIGEDVRTAMRATRSILLVHEELGEPHAAREALRQFAEALVEPAGQLRNLAKYTPYSTTANHESFWQSVETDFLPSAQGLGQRLATRATQQYLAFEFTAEELLEGGER